MNTPFYTLVRNLISQKCFQAETLGRDASGGRGRPPYFLSANRVARSLVWFPAPLGPVSALSTLSILSSLSTF